MSSSSKFFTWHPSRARAPSVEKAPSKPRRKPLPLEFDSKPKQSHRTTDSIALQDAAVQSATSLLAVMNDCLNTHLLSTQHSGGLKPLPGRPRSRTAPSTPMADTPVGQLAELEGSFPARKGHRSINPSMDSTTLRTVIHSPAHGNSVERPHSSPQDTGPRVLGHPRASSESSSRSVTSFSSAEPASNARPGSPRQRTKSQTTAGFGTSDETLVAVGTQPAASNARKSSLGVNPQWQYESVGASGRSHDSRVSSSHTSPYVGSSKAASTKQTEQAADVEGALVEQLSTMRTAHEAHVAALKESHERELASYRSYISILERHGTTSQPPRASTKKTLTLDTQTTSRDTGSDVSATTSMQSFELALDAQKRVSSEAVAEMEALKRKLSLCRKAQAEHRDVRRERDDLRDANERNDRRISQLKDIVRKGKEVEKTMKNQIGNLEAALQSANNERLDALEGFYEACEHVRKSTQREKLVVKECQDLHGRLAQLDSQWTKNASAAHNRKSEDRQEALLKRRNTLRNDPLLQQIDELRRTIVEKDLRIAELETAPVELSPHQKDLHNAERYEIATASQEARQELDAWRRRVTDAEAARDRYNSLLHTELRRQSRTAAQIIRSTTPRVESETRVAFEERLKAITNPLETSTPETQVDVLEKELRHCMQEIILYKLDIKGYKKDIKKANAEIDVLRTAGKSGPDVHIVSRDHTPQTSSNSSSKGPSPSPARTGSGLGISWPLGQTTPATVASTNSEALLSVPSTPPKPASTPSPSHPQRPKTPLGIHKKLPKPPPSSTGSPSPRIPHSPPQKQNVQRQETLRSLSESIISSYAKRTPEQGTSEQPPSGRGRNSDPSRSTTMGTLSPRVNPSMTPVARINYTSEIMKSPPRHVAMARV